MTMDGIGPAGAPTPAGFMDQMSKRSVIQPQTANSAVFSGIPATGLVLGNTRGLSDTFQETSLLQQWGNNALRWGGRDGLAHAINNAVGQQATAVKPSLIQKLKQTFSKSARAAAAASATTSYSQWLNLGSDSIRFKDANMARYKATVKSNLKNAQNPFAQKSFKKQGGGKEALKLYGRQTLLNSNVKPIKDLLTNSPDKNWGAGLSRLFALGFAGFDVIKNTKETYDQTQDGFEAATAAAKYSVRALATWELAGIGLAIGKAILPFALGPIPLGGILVGALVAALSQKLLDPILKTGDSDPNRKSKQEKVAAQVGAQATTPGG